MKTHPIARTAAALLALCATTLTTPTATLAIPNPKINSQNYPPPPDHPPAPPYPLKLNDNQHCTINATLKNSNYTDPPPANQALSINYLHTILDQKGWPLTGRGVNIAIIDSGVTPNIRLPHLTGGGDYIVPADNGLFDCDHHGTIIAGIIGAAASKKDGFIGVAPDSHIISIRTTSSMYQAVNYQDASLDTHNPTKVVASSLKSLADAIVHAVTLGANVINISVTTCYSVHTPVAWKTLAGAIHWATHIKNVVIVASAGNSSDSDCTSNPPANPRDPSDTRGWGAVTNVSLPSLFAGRRELLSVGGSMIDGEPYPGTMAGPWVSVMAPAVDIVSLDPAINASKEGRLVNGEYQLNGIHQGEVTSLNGTSFAAGYVTGIVALVRQLYPDLSASEVIKFIEEAAHHVSRGMLNMAGYGLVDPVRLLTTHPSDVAPHSPAYIEQAEPVRPKPSVDHTMRDLARVVIVSIFAVAVLVAYIGFTITSSNKRRKGFDDF